jgi:hypothetical protein
MPQPILALPVALQAQRHWLPSGQGVVSRPILNGLHHDYRFEKQAA